MKSWKARLYMRGFTLVELTVSLAIIIMLTAIFLGRYPETAVRMTLVNASHKVSLLVREAQVRGSAIDSLNSSLGGYGVYASISSSTQVTLFGDLVDGSIPKPNGIAVGNGLYDLAPINETKSISTFPKGYYISKLCVGTAFPFSCNASSSPAITSLTISFTRPNPTPNIYINNGSGTSYSAACIELRSPHAPLGGNIRTVQVYNSGMIYVTIGKCDNSPS
jgi:type II secretory pathway pseudopilin PulG